ncbi:MAG TPA: lysophospholipid acyltransferase family protein, partial [Dermatophilaceae bacterium]|nr:lysophospholipid acyltransferase family protein [Dermatophilaceae bacterium]
IFDNPVAGPLMRGMKHIPVDREAGAAAYRAAVTALRQGELIGVFPETTISRSFELLPFKSGAVRMAVSGKVPILPIVIWGSQRVWTAGHRRAIAPHRIPVSIDVLPPITVARGDDPDVATESLRSTMDRALHAAQDRYPVRPEGTEDTWWLPARLGGTAPTPAEAELIAERRALARAERKEAEEARTEAKAAAKSARKGGSRP